MAFLVGGANSAVDTEPYDIDNSLRFATGDDASLSITPDASNRDLFTISLWAKRGSLNTGARQVLFGVGNPGTSEQVGFEIRFDNAVGDGVIRITDYQAGVADYLVLYTDAVYRDPSAWYHIVYSYDSAQSTDTNRSKLYVNGSQVTSFSTETYADQNQDSAVGSNTKHLIGNLDGNGYDFDGYLAEVYYIDGTAYAASNFGETDSDSGIWKPKKASVTYGTNGFFLEFKETGTNQDSSGIGADTSGEDNHLAVTNLAATDQSTDTPTNNFCTLNPLHFDSVSYIPTFSEGNCKIVSASGNYFGTFGTIAIPEDSGLWYWEAQSTTTVNGSSQEILVGVEDEAGTEDYKSFSGQSVNGDEICGYLIDRSGNTIKTYKADALVDTSSILATGNIFVLTKCYGADADLLLNFGNPPHAISSGNADPNGYGNFEYATKSGYALCTKNLAEFG